MLSGSLTGWGKVVFFCRPSFLQVKVHLLFVWVPVLPPSAVSGPLRCLYHACPFLSLPSLLFFLSAHQHSPTSSATTCPWLGFLSLCPTHACSGHSFHTRPSGKLGQSKGQDVTMQHCPLSQLTNCSVLHGFGNQRIRHAARHFSLCQIWKISTVTTPTQCAP